MDEKNKISILTGYCRNNKDALVTASDFNMTASKVESLWKKATKDERQYCELLALDAKSEKEIIDIQKDFIQRATDTRNLILDKIDDVINNIRKDDYGPSMLASLSGCLKEVNSIIKESGFEKKGDSIFNTITDSITINVNNNGR